MGETVVNLPEQIVGPHSVHTFTRPRQRKKANPISQCALHFSVQSFSPQAPLRLSLQRNSTSNSTQEESNNIPNPIIHSFRNGVIPAQKSTCFVLPIIRFEKI
ncbi:unnamed protein product [Periconia digitata]|uniref:Uncharacterized protein n=1 Tax=Periconia digitata TaxID=1303443 RepID=A0A9W4XR23_9PLEO|nr:unnamed protein product [Periconia digitata]